MLDTAVEQTRHGQHLSRGYDEEGPTPHVPEGGYGIEGMSLTELARNARRVGKGHVVSGMEGEEREDAEGGYAGTRVPRWIREEQGLTWPAGERNDLKEREGMDGV